MNDCLLNRATYEDALEIVNALNDAENIFALAIERIEEMGTESTIGISYFGDYGGSNDRGNTILVHFYVTPEKDLEFVNVERLE